jgi:excisionase family DNA binding protein
VSDADPLLKTRQVAERFGVETATVLGWYHSGELPGIRLNGRVGAPLRFRQSDVDALAEAWADSDNDDN